MVEWLTPHKSQCGGNILLNHSNCGSGWMVEWLTSTNICNIHEWTYFTVRMLEVMAVVEWGSGWPLTICGQTFYSTTPTLVVVEWWSGWPLPTYICSMYKFELTTRMLEFEGVVEWWSGWTLTIWGQTFYSTTSTLAVIEWWSGWPPPTYAVYISEHIFFS